MIIGSPSLHTHVVCQKEVDGEVKVDSETPVLNVENYSPVMGCLALDCYG